MTNRDVLQGKWKQIRGKARERLAQMGDHDLDKIMGKREQLVGLIQEKYGYTKNKAEQDVDYFMKKMNLRRAEHGNHAFRILAVSIGTLLTIAILTVFARRQANA